MCLDCFLQIVSVIFWIVPHAVILTVDCSWFDVIINVSGVIRWTIWNTVGPTHLRNVLPGKQANYSIQFVTSEESLVFMRVVCLPAWSPGTAFAIFGTFG